MQEFDVQFDYGCWWVGKILNVKSNFNVKNGMMVLLLSVPLR